VLSVSFSDLVSFYKYVCELAAPDDVESDIVTILDRVYGTRFSTRKFNRDWDVAKHNLTSEMTEKYDDLRLCIEREVVLDSDKLNWIVDMLPDSRKSDTEVIEIVTDVLVTRVANSGNAKAAMLKGIMGTRKLSHDILKELRENKVDVSSSKKDNTVDSIESCVALGELSGAQEIAPKELLEREDEEKLLREIFSSKSGYHLFTADAYTGKSALLSWVCLTPPQNVLVVSFFVLKFIRDKSDSDGFVYSLVRQLGILAEEDIPLNQSHAYYREKLKSLLGLVIEKARNEGKRLAIVVDGLDEDESVARGKACILSFLPQEMHPNLVVVLSKRPNPPIPREPWLDSSHPVHNCVEHILTEVDVVKELRSRATNELSSLLDRGGVSYEAVSVLLAAGGYLTVDDLTEIIGCSRYEVAKLFDGSDSRLFAEEKFSLNSLNESERTGYRFSHAELQERALAVVGSVGIQDGATKITVWADKYHLNEWQGLIPCYLLSDYPRFLRSGKEWGKAADLLGCMHYINLVTSTLWTYEYHIECIDIVSDKLLKRNPPDYFRLALLHLSKRYLSHSEDLIPREVPSLLAQLGLTEEALALAERGKDSFPWRLASAVDLAHVFIDTGDVQSALRAADFIVNQCTESDYFLSYSIYPPVNWIREAACIYAKCGEVEKALEVLHKPNDLVSPVSSPFVLCEGYVDVLVLAGEEDRVRKALAKACEHDNVWELLAYTRYQIQSGNNEEAHVNLRKLLSTLDSGNNLKGLLEFVELASAIGILDEVSIASNLPDALVEYIEPLVCVISSLIPEVDKEKIQELIERDDIHSMPRHEIGKVYSRMEKMTSLHSLPEFYKAIAKGAIHRKDLDYAKKLLYIAKEFFDSGYKLFGEEYIDVRNYGCLAELIALAGDVDGATSVLIEAEYDSGKMGNRDHKLDSFGIIVEQLWEDGKTEEAKRVFCAALDSEQEWILNMGEDFSRGYFYYAGFAGLSALFFDLEYSLSLVVFDARMYRDPLRHMACIAKSSILAGKLEDAKIVIRKILEFTSSSLAPDKEDPPRAEKIARALLASNINLELAERCAIEIDDYYSSEKLEVLLSIALALCKSGKLEKAKKLLLEVANKFAVDRFDHKEHEIVIEITEELENSGKEGEAAGIFECFIPAPKEDRWFLKTVYFNALAGKVSSDSLTRWLKDRFGEDCESDLLGIAWLGLAQAYARMNNLKLSNECLNRAEECTAKAHDSRLYFQTLLRLGRVYEALSCYEKIKGDALCLRELTTFIQECLSSPFVGQLAKELAFEIMRKRMTSTTSLEDLGHLSIALANAFRDEGDTAGEAASIGMALAALRITHMPYAWTNRDFARVVEGTDISNEEILEIVASVNLNTYEVKRASMLKAAYDVRPAAEIKKAIEDLVCNLNKDTVSWGERNHFFGSKVDSWFEVVPENNQGYEILHKLLSRIIVEEAWWRWPKLFAACDAIAFEKLVERWLMMKAREG